MKERPSPSKLYIGSDSRLNSEQLSKKQLISYQNHTGKDTTNPSKPRKHLSCCATIRLPPVLAQHVQHVIVHGVPERAAIKVGIDAPPAAVDVWIPAALDVAAVLPELAKGPRVDAGGRKGRPVAAHAGLDPHVAHLGVDVTGAVAGDALGEGSWEEVRVSCVKWGRREGLGLAFVVCWVERDRSGGGQGSARSTWASEKCMVGLWLLGFGLIGAMRRDVCGEEERTIWPRARHVLL